MKTVVYYRPDGVIQQTSETYSQTVNPPTIDGLQVLIVDERVDGAHSHVVDGVVVAGALPAEPAPPDTDLETYEWDSGSGRWRAHLTLAGKKAAKWEEMKVQRSAIEFGQFVWDGSTFDSDPTSTSRIMGAFALAMAAAAAEQPFSIEWTLADNTTRVLSGEDMIAVGTTLGARVAAAHQTAGQLRAAIAATESEAALDAITWPG